MLSLKKIFFYLLLILFVESVFFNKNYCYSQTKIPNNDTIIDTPGNLGAPFIRNFSPKEYDGSSQNWAIVQDKRGFLYFGNNDGVLEYDGKNWRLIEVSNNSIVLSLSIDSNGTIFVGAIGEFGYMATDSTGLLSYISLKNKLSDVNTEFIDVCKVHATKYGVYFITKNKIFRWHNDEIFVIPANLKTLFGFNVYDELFVIQNDSGIYIVENNKLILLPGTKKIVKDYGRIILIPYTDNKILICTSKEGFFIYDFKKYITETTKSSNTNSDNEQIQTSYIKKFNTQIEEYLKYNRIYSSVKVNDNKYAFATLNGGIIIMDKKGKLLQLINKNRGLQDNSVFNIYVDKNQNLWAALNLGVTIIEISSPITKFDELSGLDGVVLSTIEHKGKRYASTMYGLYYLPEYKINSKNDKNIFLPVLNTQSSCFDFYSDKNVLLALGNSGIILINDTIATNLFDIGQIYCHSLSKKFPNHIFFGITDGFASIEIISSKEKNKYKNHYKNEKIIPEVKVKFIDNGKFKDIEESIIKVISDSVGDLWLSSFHNGIIHLKFQENNISDYTITRYDTTNGLPQLSENYVHNINKNIVIGTKKGIYKAIINQKSFNDDFNFEFIPDTSFGKIYSSDSISVEQIYLDRKNEIWINSSIGISKITKTNKNPDNKYSLPIKRIPVKSIYKLSIDKDNIIWICSSDGLYRFNPVNEKICNIPFYSHIRKVIIGNDSIIFNGTYFVDSLLKNNYYTLLSFVQPKNLIPVILYKNNSITFEYSTTYYEKGESNLFRYFLVGFDKQWSNWTPETKKEYTNLPEGTYYFKVEAKNIYNLNSNAAIYKFIIFPPWYRTIVAYIIYIILSILLIIIIVKIYTRRLKNAKKLLEKIVKERTTEIRKQNTEISHQKEEIQLQAEHLSEVNEELEKLSIVASKTDNAIIIMDAKGNFEWVNDGFTNLYEITIDELINDFDKNIIKATPNTNAQELIKYAIQNKKTINYESYFLTKSKKKIWNQTTLTPILDEKGNIKKLIAIDSDISKLKKAEEKIIKQKEEITDSIVYAKRIQNALFPSKEIMDTTISQYFVLDMPRGIVSGDFYWFSKIKDKIVISVADCTGHGVPGAFMSMLGVSFLNKIVNEKGIIKPNEILDRLRNNVIISLHQTGEAGEANDGMDIALIAIDKKSNILEYAGANNSVYLIRNNELTEIFADKMPICIYREIETPFSCQKISIQTGDMLYLFTDGYVDQFGGSKGRKFLYKNFKNLLKEIHKLPVNEQKKLLKDRLIKWKEGYDQIDDILIMGIKI
ncbi:MAG: SpoIIE family protein phosphatase [Bacteroidales bacterium]|nr:SpoIIE family protein phosphatase [Bacteroidales bacterium]